MNLKTRLGDKIFWLRLIYSSIPSTNQYDELLRLRFTRKEYFIAFCQLSIYAICNCVG